MAENRRPTRGRAWRIVLLLSVVVAVLATTSPASASSRPDVGQSVATALIANNTVHGCPFYYFCAYSGTNYSGTKIQMYFCQFYNMPFVGNGSWVNNQTPGTRAGFYDFYYNRIYLTAGAYSQSGSYNWTPVFHVKPC